ncbi:hypothetical protein TNCV_4699661 [Trichonephila clavipes]|nr:hypothetical protein TNCV_4699661 [Trichonephila clavipes]
MLVPHGGTQGRRIMSCVKKFGQDLLQEDQTRPTVQKTGQKWYQDSITYLYRIPTFLPRLPINEVEGVSQRDPFPVRRRLNSRVKYLRQGNTVALCPKANHPDNLDTLKKPPSTHITGCTPEAKDASLVSIPRSQRGQRESRTGDGLESPWGAGIPKKNSLPSKQNLDF